ncbi:MAG: FkbM family methyltransferase [bacterium]|nr:FkbM family methyltransferase [bacterium]
MPETNYLNYQISYLNHEEFSDLKREIFTYQIYYFESDTAKPIIIDGGAHIGLSSLYFKHLYPQARILAFEPNPTTFTLLEKNVQQNHLEEITLYQKALSQHNGQANFFADKTDWQWLSTSSFIENAWNGQQKIQSPITVETTRLDQYLAALPRIDLLKLDIEGAETSVIMSIRDQLEKIQNLIFEFHPTKNQNLSQLLSFLNKRGFSTSLHDRQGKTLKVFHQQELIIVQAQRESAK